MEIIDSGIVLSVRKFNEYGGVIRVLTEQHGLYAGVDRYAFSSKRRALYQPGNRVQVKWQARLSEHLGTFTSELLEPIAAFVMGDRLKLATLQSACQLTDLLLNEREPQPEVWDSLYMLANSLRNPDTCHPELVSGSISPHTPPKQAEGWMLKQVQHDNFLIRYVLLEMLLLETAGFGLDLAQCAVTGEIDDLAYVSPKSGRAVTRAAGAAYREKLFPLPPFLLPNRQKTAIFGQDLLDALRLTGYFLATRALNGAPGNLPQARERLVKMATQNHTVPKAKSPEAA